LAGLGRARGLGSGAEATGDRRLGAVRAAGVRDEEQTRHRRETQQPAQVGPSPLTWRRERDESCRAEYERRDEDDRDRDGPGEIGHGDGTEGGAKGKIGSEREG